MKTRFDSTKVWRAYNDELPISEMETAHLINTINMFIKHPERVMSMLVRDIERYRDNVMTAWTADGSEDNVVRESLHNVTSMSNTELSSYALNSALGKAIIGELENRGANTENLITEALNAVNLELDR